jgi:protein involved in polysaccharide export with SLBB domain
MGGCATPRNSGFPPIKSKGEDLSDNYYRVRKLDMIKIVCIEDPKASIEAVINSEGEVDLYQLNRVKVEGLTMHEIKDLLAKLYIKAELYKNPHFNVSIQGYAERFVTVTGLVGVSGKVGYHPDKGISFVQAIVAARGIQPRGNPRDIILTRKEKVVENGKERFEVKQYSISYKRIQNNQDDDFDLVEEDWVNVHEDYF